ncbi:metallohydrolase [Salinisphaera sp. P385]|uniref:Metallohydrolase n=1 Tax=Spectribacter acetivorans TaxID=3075603 RepID=A0ABU3B777_9GAMM|nr:metallohydrolase [Salinisphaera sp. P385]MDT0618304.1 metallohydrolase [Salinisphaera sp. P385]
MALVCLDNRQTILLDLNIREAADDDGADMPDVASQLRERLERDEYGRMYLDAFLLSHPDQDHVNGLRNHFHLGPPDEWSRKEDKILIREIWSSPVVFRRASAINPLCEDARAWATEARRRVKRFRESGGSTTEGDRILLMGEDTDGKTDDILDIVVKVDDVFSMCNRIHEEVFEARLLCPLPVADDDDEETFTKNDSSVVVRFSLKGGGTADQCRFLTGGDAGVAIWKRLWRRHGDTNTDWLTYNILQTPHHCSWRSLSFDRWSDLGEQVKVDPDARQALSQTKKGAVIVASSKPIKKGDDNPPHERAKREYIDILGGDHDRFYCTDEHWNENNQALEFEIKASGITRKIVDAATSAGLALGIGATAAQPRQHG